MIEINIGTKTRNNFGVPISFEVFRNLKWETKASLSDFQFSFLILSKLSLIISVKIFHLIIIINYFCVSYFKKLLLFLSRALVKFDTNLKYVRGE